MSFEFEATNSSNAWFGYNFPNEGRDFQNFMWLYRGPQFDKKKNTTLIDGISIILRVVGPVIALSGSFSS